MKTSDITSPQPANVWVLVDENPDSINDAAFAVDMNDKPVGFIQAHRVCIIEVGFRVEILGLVVSASARRSGIGQALIKEAERWAKSNGAEAVSVRSNTRRIEAHIFYPALGYKKIKTQAVYEKQRARSRERGARSREE